MDIAPIPKVKEVIKDNEKPAAGAVPEAEQTGGDKTETVPVAKETTKTTETGSASEDNIVTLTNKAIARITKPPTFVDTKKPVPKENQLRCAWLDHHAAASGAIKPAGFCGAMMLKPVCRRRIKLWRMIFGMHGGCRRSTNFACIGHRENSTH